MVNFNKICRSFNSSGFSGCLLIAADWVQHRGNACDIYDRKCGTGKGAVISGYLGYLLQIIIAFVLYTHTYYLGLVE
jgi:hypothetical protein